MKGIDASMTNIIVVLAVLMVSYLGITMMIDSTGTGLKKLNNGGEDPAFGVGLGNNVSQSDGDMVGVYNANITGGVKLNYPWPLRDGPGWSVDLYTVNTKIIIWRTGNS